MTTHIWLRSETKPMEERTALTPAATKALLAKGFQVTVEDCPQRAIPIEHYQEAGCTITEAGAWLSAPADAIIVGLKELDEATFPLTHSHIHFAHVYKEQSGWAQFLNRFNDGGGKLFDLEYLVDESGRRVAAFGYWAGFAGAAVATKAWLSQKAQHQSMPALKSMPNKQRLIEEINTELSNLNNTVAPKAMVIGAKGRSGKGAVEFFKAIGIQVTEWDIEETQQGGPFDTILSHDIFVNCVFVQTKIPPFITAEMLAEERKLSVICDVSCDPYGDYNPLPIYNKCTTFDKPCLRIVDGDQPLDLVAIDHLPSLLPVESSEDYCQQLLPHLLTLDSANEGIWQRAIKIFNEKKTLALTTLEK